MLLKKKTTAKKLKSQRKRTDEQSIYKKNDKNSNQTKQTKKTEREKKS